MLQVVGDDLNKDGTKGYKPSWEKLNGSLSSIPYHQPFQKEQWFTSLNTHDSGAVNDFFENPH